MACGMPVIASARGETVRVIEEAECGLCSEIGDVEGLAENIKKLIKMDLFMLKKQSREYFDKNFDKHKLMNEMDKYFTEENNL